MYLKILLDKLEYIYLNKSKSQDDIKNIEQLCESLYSRKWSLMSPLTKMELINLILCSMIYVRMPEIIEDGLYREWLNSITNLIKYGNTNNNLPELFDIEQAIIKCCYWQFNHNDLLSEEIKENILDGKYYTYMLFRKDFRCDNADKNTNGLVTWVNICLFELIRKGKTEDNNFDNYPFSEQFVYSIPKIVLARNINTFKSNQKITDMLELVNRVLEKNALDCKNQVYNELYYYFIYNNFNIYVDDLRINTWDIINSLETSNLSDKTKEFLREYFAEELKRKREQEKLKLERLEKEREEKERRDKELQELRKVRFKSLEPLIDYVFTNQNEYMYKQRFIIVNLCNKLVDNTDIQDMEEYLKTASYLKLVPGINELTLSIINDYFGIRKLVVFNKGDKLHHKETNVNLICLSSNKCYTKYKCFDTTDDTCKIVELDVNELELGWV